MSGGFCCTAIGGFSDLTGLSSPQFGKPGPTPNEDAVAFGPAVGQIIIQGDADKSLAPLYKRMRAFGSTCPAISGSEDGRALLQ